MVVTIISTFLRFCTLYLLLDLISVLGTNNVNKKWLVHKLMLITNQLFV